MRVRVQRREDDGAGDVGEPEANMDVPDRLTDVQLGPKANGFLERNVRARLVVSADEFDGLDPHLLAAGEVGGMLPTSFPCVVP